MRWKLIAFIFAGICSYSSAEIIDNGWYTTDTDSGLDWLDLTETTGLSAVAVNGMLQAGGQLDGWRYATTFEFQELIVNLGFDLTEGCSLIESRCGTDHIDQNSNLALALSLLGDTQAANWEDIVYPNGTTQSLISGTSWGLMPQQLLHPEQSQNYHRVVITNEDYLMCPLDADCFVLVNQGAVRIGSPIDSGDLASQLVGHYLVRDSAVVPLPSASWLLLSAIASLLGFKRASTC